MKTKLKRFIIPLLIVSISLVGCSTIPTSEPLLYSEIVPVPTRPRLEPIPQEPIPLTDLMKLMGVNMLNTTTYSERLEDYIYSGETYYKRVHSVSR